MMPFIHIDLLELILKGLLIGIIASAPMGPVGILCIQRTLNKGRWYGFVTGVGATCKRHYLCAHHWFGYEAPSWISSQTPPTNSSCNSPEVLFCCCLASTASEAIHGRICTRVARAKVLCGTMRSQPSSLHSPTH